jgi:hypothetical protein
MSLATGSIPVITIYPKHRADPIPLRKQIVRHFESIQRRNVLVVQPSPLTLAVLKWTMAITFIVAYTILIVWLFGLAVHVQQTYGPVLPAPKPLPTILHNAGLGQLASLSSKIQHVFVK